MARKAQKRRQRAKLDAVKKRRILAGQDVFGNDYLIAKILIEMRKLKGVGPLDLVRFSALNKKARRAVIYLLPKRVWWTSVMCSCDDALKGNNRWLNKMGRRVYFLRCKDKFEIDLEKVTFLDKYIMNSLSDEEYSKKCNQYDEARKIYFDFIENNKLPSWWVVSFDSFDFSFSTGVTYRKRMYLRWKNGGGGLK